MSQFYKESDLETTFELYNKNIFYSNEMLKFAERYSCVVDFKFGEKFLYGRVNRNYIAIEPSQTILDSYTTLPNTGQDVGQLQVMSFVAEAFADLTRHFQRSTQIGAIRKEDPYLSNLKAYDTYEKPNIAYSNYTDTLITAMTRVKKSTGLQIKNFQDFLNFLITFSKSVGTRFPITKTGFVKSRFNSNMNNAISIEVTDLSYQNDDNKINGFISSPNFEYYLNACNSFGFMVDIDIPWRIVADLDSVSMQAYASRYGFSNTDAVLRRAFSKTHISYFQNFISQLLEIYNTLTETFIMLDECSQKPIFVKPEQYTLEQIKELYNQNYFIKLYCMLRFLEEGEKNFSEAKQNKIITDVVNLSSVKNINLAIERFERIVSQPFDYRGSLSYIVREQAKREDI